MFANVDVVSVILALCVFQQHVTEINANVRRRRSVILKCEVFHWPNNEVPFAFDTTHVGVISGFEIVTAELAAKTCIKFTQVDLNSTKYKVIINDGPDGCHSTVGYLKLFNPNNEQEIGMQPDKCLNLAIFRHEIQHTLGVDHQQRAYDRDKYVRVIEENIEPTDLHNFKKMPASFVSYFGTKYDFKSNMHYTSNEHTINGREAIIAHDPKNHLMIKGRTNPRFSFYDLMALNNAYKCGEKCRGECDGYFDKYCSCITPNDAMFGGTVENPKWPPKNPPNYKAPVSDDGKIGVLNGTYSIFLVWSDLHGQYVQPNVGKSFKRNKQGIKVYYVKERDEFLVPLTSNKIAEGLYFGNKYLYPESIAGLTKEKFHHTTDEYGRVWLFFLVSAEEMNTLAYLASPGRKRRRQRS